MTLIAEYFTGNEAEWDRFVLRESMNGTFLQTRKFINYHPNGRFVDRSICVRKGNELVAVILGCECLSTGQKVFFAHKGTTFGGITISPKIYSASMIDELMQVLEAFWKENGFEKVYLKMVSQIYEKEDTSLLDYFMFKYGYTNYNELNYYLKLDEYQEDIIAQFSSSKRRDYRYSLKNGLAFRELQTREEIADYYEVLLKNLKKLNVHAVHSLEELYDLKFNRFPDRVQFYGVFHEGKIIAGSMIFLYDGQVFHTQYLSSDEEYQYLFPMDFLIGNLIQIAVNQGMKIFSFGICTEDRGRYLNLGLSRFKEGFGTVFCINHSYEKAFLGVNTDQMSLRGLKKKDAPMMLEWMHEPMVVKNMKTDFASKTIKDCEEFIETADKTHEHLHMAIADKQDEYMGTVSLKHISQDSAELGVVVRTIAMGRGFSKFGIEKIIEKGFRDLGIRKIYWCVDPDNQRAVRFYDKNGYQRSTAPRDIPGYTEEEIGKYIWYQVLAQTRNG